MVRDPVTMRSRLRGELRRRRTAAGKSQRDVAEALDWSPSKVNRIENGLVSISTTDLRALLNYYQVTDRDVIAELVEMARTSKRLPFSEYRETFASNTWQYFGYEATASAIRGFELLAVPGLLQTTDYTSALLDIYDIGEDVFGQYIESRRERQRLLDRDPPPDLHVIMDEPVLARPVGGAAVMSEQLQYLLAAADRPNVTIQVLPLATGAHVGMRGSFVLLELPDKSDADVLYMEGRTSTDHILSTDRQITGPYREMFDLLADSACRPCELADYIRRAISSFDIPEEAQ